MRLCVVSGVGGGVMVYEHVVVCRFREICTLCSLHITVKLWHLGLSDGAGRPV